MNKYIEEINTIDSLIENAIKNCNERELAIGFLRYEALRKLNPIQFAKLHAKNLKGKNFDEMVNKLVIEND